MPQLIKKYLWQHWIAIASCLLKEGQKGHKIQKLQQEIPETQFSRSASLVNFSCCASWAQTRAEIGKGDFGFERLNRIQTNLAKGYIILDTHLSGYPIFNQMRCYARHFWRSWELNMTDALFRVNFPIPENLVFISGSTGGVSYPYQSVYHSGHPGALRHHGYAARSSSEDATWCNHFHFKSTQLTTLNHWRGDATNTFCWTHFHKSIASIFVAYAIFPFNTIPINP